MRSLMEERLTFTGAGRLSTEEEGQEDALRVDLLHFNSLSGVARIRQAFGLLVGADAI